MRIPLFGRAPTAVLPHFLKRGRRTPEGGISGNPRPGKLSPVYFRATLGHEPGFRARRGMPSSAALATYPRRPRQRHEGSKQAPGSDRARGSARAPGDALPTLSPRPPSDGTAAAGQLLGTLPGTSGCEGSLGADALGFQRVTVAVLSAHLSFAGNIFDYEQQHVQ